MNRAFDATTCCIGLTVVLIGARSEGAQTASPGPYYAWPSWDQKLAASTRFVVLSNWNNEAVLDRETGLTWAEGSKSERDDLG
jgi:hypothetical protein